MPLTRAPERPLADNAMPRQDESSSAAPAATIEQAAADHGAAAPSSAAPRPYGRERTRTSVTFNALLAGAVVLILLLVFTLENTQSVKITYFGADGHIALGIALLLAAVGGALLVGLVGAARLLQLRRRMHRSAK
jgi:uncharacterized integral membrane protein